MMSQPGFFDLQERYEELSFGGDPLVRLESVIDWKIFLPLLNRAFERERKSAAGRKPYPRLMMLKIVVLQGLYNLSDHQLEFQIRDRLSFMRFLGLSFENEIPDEKTIWAFREVLVKGRVMDKLFNRFNRALEAKGFNALSGHMVDASIVEVPKQRNSRDENKQIKQGEKPESFEKNPHRDRQKDIQARWTIKGHTRYYGYKDHVIVDADYKLIRGYEVTHAAQGDVTMLESLLDKLKEAGNRVWADAAYYSGAVEEMLKEKGFDSRIIKRFQTHQPEWSNEDRENKRRSKIRKRVEHVFGFMENSMGGKFIRSIGLDRAKQNIGLMNWVYNLCRYEQLCRIGTS